MSGPVALVLRALGLGDFLTGLPAVQLIRRALPDHRLVLAAPAALAPLVDLVPDIDELFVRGELQPLIDFDRRVSVGVDLHGKGPASRRLLAGLTPGRLVGFADPGAGLSGPQWRRQEHEVTRWCRLVDEAFCLGLPPADWPGVAGTLAHPAPAEPGVTLVHPGAAAGSRRWPADRFAVVAAALADRGHRVQITGGRAEIGLAQQVAELSGTTARTGSTLAELAGLVAGARLVVCGDTGVAHLASAFGTPSVLLFGPVSPRLWGPPDDPRHVVLWHGDGTGDPHGSEPDGALLRITIDEVLEAALGATGALPSYGGPVSDRWYCTDHARHDELVGATCVSDGRSVCPDHAPLASAVPHSGRLAGPPPHCDWCLRTPHRAYFLVEQLPLCIRHAADALFPDDDMGAHAMAHAAYLTLGSAGVRDAY